MHRAFVLQLSPDSDSSGSFTGKVEHVRSGAVIHFTSLNEFVEFVLQTSRAENHTGDSDV